MVGTGDRFDGKVVLVTGGTRGLGREMAGAFAARGATVVVSSRKAEACDAAAEEIARESGGAAVGIACHVGRWDEIERLLDTVYDRFGALNCLVNNAGISPTYDRLSGVSEELWDKTFAVNLKGPFRLTALAGERMKSAGRGTVVNISSVASIRPDAHWLPYSAAKAGLNALTEGFAQALGPEVRINGIICGAFMTDIANGWDSEETAERMRATTALWRAARPEEVVGAVLHLAGDSSSYTTGAMLRVDGGRR
jgi:NAD(P)-dependent dehydrogenase (short-subunit alcohol dehydrogenase family)